MYGMPASCVDHTREAEWGRPAEQSLRFGYFYFIVVTSEKFIITQPIPNRMDKIEIKYTMAYLPDGQGQLTPQPALGIGMGLPGHLEAAKQAYENLCAAMDAFIRKVNSIDGKEVKVIGGLELFVK